MHTLRRECTYEGIVSQNAVNSEIYLTCCKCGDKCRTVPYRTLLTVVSDASAVQYNNEFQIIVAFQFTSDRL